MNKIQQLSAAMPSTLPTACKAFLNFLMGLTDGHLHLTTPEGNHLIFGNLHQQPSATLKIKDWRACTRIFRAGDIGFAECLEEGWVESPDLTALLRLAILNEDALSRLINGDKLASFWYRLKYLLHPESRRYSRHDIHTQYDMGDDFYELWLDSCMTYSSALFEGDFSLSLHDAQTRKYQRIIDQLELIAGDHVLELGCEWGGFAAYAAKYGIHVTGTTNSASQLTYAKHKINAIDMQDRVNIHLRNYQDLRDDLTKKYDAVVSIEMFESVGEECWLDYFGVISECLNSGGRALIQTVTIPERDFERYRSNTDFIQQYIFPGVLLPSSERFCFYAGAAGLETLREFSFGKDYAETFRRWHEAWQKESSKMAEMGYDERFMRIWRLYFAYCEAGFDEGKTDVVQFVLRKL